MKISLDLPIYLDPADPRALQRVAQRHGRRALLTAGQLVSYHARNALDRLFPEDESGGVGGDHMGSGSQDREDG